MRDTLAPEAEVQFNAERHLRIERIATPLPVAEPNQSYLMIGLGIADSCCGWSVADGLQGAVGGIDAFGRAEEVDIGLRPKPRVGDIVGSLREALDDDVLRSSLLQRFGSFPVGCLHAIEAESIVSKIGLEPLDHPVRKPSYGELRNLQSEVGEVAEGEQAGPLLIG